MAGPAWPVVHLRGTAADLHGRALAWSERSVTFCDVTRPAVVIGSTQPSTHVDAGAAAAAGVDVVRRRSGGGAVLVEPGGLVWADVVVPAGDELWHADVGRSFWWLGEVWAAALGDLGAGRAGVHRGPLERSKWSPMVCFAGLGPGEVRDGGRKLLGMAQRRTRDGALLQCAVLLGDPGAVLALLALDGSGREAAAAELEACAGRLGGVTAAEVEAAFLARLP